MVYNSSQSAYNALEKEKESREYKTKNREEAIDWILLVPEYSYKFLIKTLYINDDEYNKVKKHLLRTSQAYIAEILTNNRIYLTNEEIKDAENFVLTCPYSCKTLLEKKYYNNKEYKVKLLNGMLKNLHCITSYIRYSDRNDGLRLDDDMLYLVKENINFEYNLRTLFDSLRYFQNEARRLCFSELINSKDYLFDKAYQNLLNKEELIILHDFYEEESYKELSTTYQAYLKYCLTFHNCLSYREQELLVKKVLKTKKEENISLVSNRVTLEKEFHDMIDSYHVLKELSTPIA